VTRGDAAWTTRRRRTAARGARADDLSRAAMTSDGELAANYHKWFLDPTPTGENLNLPMSLQLTEALRAMGVDEF
jgi:hypothetical protein